VGQAGQVGSGGSAGSRRLRRIEAVLRGRVRDRRHVGDCRSRRRVPTESGYDVGNRAHPPVAPPRELDQQGGSSPAPLTPAGRGLEHEGDRAGCFALEVGVVAAADYVYAVRLDDVGLVAEPAHGAPRFGNRRERVVPRLGLPPWCDPESLIPGREPSKAPPEPAGARSGEFPKPRPRDPFSRLGGRLVERADLVEEPLPILQDPLRALLGPLVVRVGRELPPAKISKVREIVVSDLAIDQPGQVLLRDLLEEVDVFSEPATMLADRVSRDAGEWGRAGVPSKARLTEPRVSPLPTGGSARSARRRRSR
jgi:hypothetical protein